jgi:eukaryotic-like serine/threonine-protein kinase
VSIGAPDLIRLSSLLEEALTLTPTARAAWLASLPDTDRPYEDALRRMFDAEHGAEPLLGAMPTLRLIEEAIDAQVGDVVGAYRLVRAVASGGMGSVWLAERVDGALRRQVALKLPHLAWGAGLAERMA